VSLADIDERAWWSYLMPGPLDTEHVVHVPADTEAQARAIMRANSYSGAPIDTYPLLGSRWCSRDTLKREALQ
jgi:hypothetical protein